MVCATLANLAPGNPDKPRLRAFEPGDFFTSVPIGYTPPEPEELEAKLIAFFAPIDNTQTVR